MARYAWDPEKARVNLAKHGVSFEQARDAIEHPLSRAEQRPVHVRYEERSKIIGWSSAKGLLVVIVSASGPQPRIISARRATKRERHAYEARP
jgi:uncharacterized DUF497 family protein